MNIKLTLLFLILAAVIGYQFCNLTAISLWHDEAFSVLLIKYDFKEMIHRIGLDVHPPFYYIVFKGWASLFGDSLFSLRSFSILFGVLTVLGLYFLVKETFKNRKMALFSATLLALNSFQIQYNMEGRMYTLGAFLIVISSYFLFKAVLNRSWAWWLLYALAASCGIYTHYYVFFFILAQGIFVLYHLCKKPRLRFFSQAAASYLLIILSYLPWLKIFLRQLSQVQETYWIPPINFGSIPNTFYKMTTGTGIDPVKFWYVSAILMLFVVAAIFYFLKKNEASAKWLIFSLLIIPFLATVLMSLKTSIYLDRYFIFTLPFYLTLMAGAILEIKNKKAKNILIVLTVLGTLIAFPLRWSSLDIEKKPGIQGAANYLNQQVQPGDKIYVGSSFVYFTFKYYNRTGIHPLLYVPGELPHFSGTALLSPEDAIRDFQQETKKGDTVWLINTTGFGNWQPELPSDWIKETEKGFQEVYEHQGWIVVSKYHL